MEHRGTSIPKADSQGASRGRRVIPAQDRRLQYKDQGWNLTALRTQHEPPGWGLSVPRAFLVTNQGCSGKVRLCSRGRGRLASCISSPNSWIYFQNLEFETTCSQRFWLLVIDSHLLRNSPVVFYKNMTSWVGELPRETEGAPATATLITRSGHALEPSPC